MEEKSRNRVAFYTLGCKVNQYETNGMAQKFLENGYQIVNFDDVADIYIINTCTVTNISDRKSRQMLRQAKKNNPQSFIVACGCYVQVAKEEVEKMPEIDFVVGTNEKNKIIKLIEERLENNTKINNIDNVMQNCEYQEFGNVTYTEKTRAVVKVQDGCDRFCTYCIIPYARGRVRSRLPQNIIREISEIAKKGIQEVVITGIHIASYGKDFKNDYKLIDLLEEINKIDGICRIRLGSIEPLLITDDFLERLKKLKKICHHFHLSLQSGCQNTLERMNRRYSIKEFESIVKKLREAYDDVILTTDIIVGFPGETEEEFNETYEFLRKIKFFKMHIFKYSPRKGTKAAIMKEQVDGETKEKRSNLLLELSDANEKFYLSKMIGKELEVLFEEKEGQYYKGHTQNYIEVKCNNKTNLENKMVKVKIIECCENSLIGQCNI